MLCLFIAGLFVSNTYLKAEFDKVDKNDLYWTYSKILEQPFHHLNIEGGNLTHIAFEQSEKPSVKVLNDWLTSRFAKDHAVMTRVKNDTLYLKFPKTYKDIYEKNWLSRNTIVRIFAPQLLSVTGNDTNFEMYKMSQKSIQVNLKGKSTFELESMIAQFDTLKVVMRDSSAVTFELAPEFKGTKSFHVKSIKADIQGYSYMDVGFAQIDDLKLNIADSSAVMISGSTYKKK
jgi:hypothetical protein